MNSVGCMYVCTHPIYTYYCVYVCVYICTIIIKEEVLNLRESSGYEGS